MRGRSRHTGRDLKPGAELQLEITDVAYGGAGLGRHEGRVVFVPFTIAGETVRARITKAHRSWLAAELLDVLRESPDRVTPPCRFFGGCGGCAYQHIAYPRQLEIKARQVAETLRRIGKFADPPVEPARGSPLEFGYRNRITVHVDPPAVGFRGLDPRELVEVDRCLLADETVNAALAALRERRRLHAGPATLRSGPPGGGFRQVNTAAAEVLAGVVGEMAGSGPLLVDAYCGGGFFARRLREAFARVVGLDWDARGIESARRDAAPHEEYLAGDASELLAGTLDPAAVVLLDPPAQGVARGVIESLLSARPAKIVYVSCDPATLARDLRALAGGYQLRRVCPVDMFPQTASIETACLLEA